MGTHHTPGPWAVVVDMRTEYDRTSDRESEWLAGYDVTSEAGEIVGCEGIITGGNNEANARLIAAAPDLLAACEALLNFAAIAKATAA